MDNLDSKQPSLTHWSDYVTVPWREKSHYNFTKEPIQQKLSIFHNFIHGLNYGLFGFQICMQSWTVEGCTQL